MGKSWLALLMAECITSHFPLFGYTSKRNHVLYYSLEDGIRQCKYRLNKIGSQWSPLLHFCDAVRDISGIMSGIRETDARIVFIDTFIAFSDIEDNNSYSETTRKVRELKRIADTLNIAIVVVHHKKKGSIGNKDWMESSMGSQGLVGAADCVISLERERGKDEAVLLMSGRSVSDRHIEIQWEDCTWVKRVK
jgi:RecA-family ATPase